jgi:hypothetical protein
MTNQASRSRAWKKRTSQLLDEARQAELCADILEDVDPRWRGLVHVLNGGTVIHLLPLGDNVNHEFRLQVHVSKTGWSFRLTHKEPLDAERLLKRRMSDHSEGPAVLDAMLGDLLGRRTVPQPSMEPDGWTEVVDGFRSFGRRQAAKGDLLDAVDPKWREPCEIYDSSREFGITRPGDTPDDGVCVWIQPARDRWAFSLRAQNPKGGTKVIREAVSPVAGAAESLDELLAAMVGDAPVPQTSAQDSYRLLLRDHVGPALRRDGFKGPSGQYGRLRDGYAILIGFRKSRGSTRDAVDYEVRASGWHPPDAALSTRRTSKPGSWHGERRMLSAELVIHPRSSERTELVLDSAPSRRGRARARREVVERDLRVHLSSDRPTSHHRSVDPTAPIKTATGGPRRSPTRSRRHKWMMRLEP